MESMKRIAIWLCCATLLFGGGLLAGRLIPSNQPNKDLVTTIVSVDPDAVDAPVLRPVPLSDSVTPVSFEQSFETGRAPDASNPAEVETCIRRYFPDIDDDTLKGWVDAYQDTSISELDALLQQKQQLADLMPSSEFFLSQPYQLPELKSTPTEAVNEVFAVGPAPAISELPAVSSVQQNLLHTMTPGYRRTVVRSMLASMQATGVEFTSCERTFETGAVTASDNPLHLAISDQRNIMFKVEPGELLTRNGAFERLGNGLLGLRLADGTELHLHDRIRVPDGVRDVQFSDGEIRFITHEAAPTTAKFTLVRVFDLSRLTSADGVLFSTQSIDDDGFEVIEAAGVRSGALEKSNVSLADESRLLEHLNEILKFSPLTAN